MFLQSIHGNNFMLSFVNSVSPANKMPNKSCYSYSVGLLTKGGGREEPISMCSDVQAIRQFGTKFPTWAFRCILRGALGT